LSCPTVKPVSCLSGWTLQDITETKAVNLATNLPVSTLSYTLTSFPPNGQRRYAILLSGYDANGVYNTSPRITAYVTVPIIEEILGTTTTILNPGN
jgi:hypothetical protein